MFLPSPSVFASRASPHSGVLIDAGAATPSAACVRAQVVARTATLLLHAAPPETAALRHVAATLVSERAWPQACRALSTSALQRGRPAFHVLACGQARR